MREPWLGEQDLLWKFGAPCQICRQLFTRWIVSKRALTKFKVHVHTHSHTSWHSTSALYVQIESEIGECHQSALRCEGRSGQDDRPTPTELL